MQPLLFIKRLHTTDKKVMYNLILTKCGQTRYQCEFYYLSLNASAHDDNCYVCYLTALLWFTRWKWLLICPWVLQRRHAASYLVYIKASTSTLKVDAHLKSLFSKWKTIMLVSNKICKYSGKSS